MGRTARALAAAACIAAGLGLAACNDDLQTRPSSQGRFAYLIQTSAVATGGGPATQVRLARITEGLKPQRFGIMPVTPKAADVRVLMDTAKVNSPTEVVQMFVSPLNTRLLVYSSELPLNALDQNLDVWNVTTGNSQGRFNEHRAASYMNKTTCPSAAFKAYLADAYPGAPPAVTDGVDYALAVDGVDGANVASPQILGWIDEQKLALKWKFRFNTSDGGASLEETFDIVITWPPGGGLATMVCAPAPAVPAAKTALTADPTIKLRKKKVLFVGKARDALQIAGNIWP